MPRPEFRHRLRPVAMAVLLGALLQLWVMWDQGIFPLGRTPRGMGDYGPQYVPFHRALAAMLHGSHLVGPGFNWLSGGGVDFLPDYATYVASPFSLLVGLFPLDRVELAMTVSVVVRLALAAGAMTALLAGLAPTSRPWPAVLLGVAYSTSAWVYDIAVYTPQWLDGLLGFPLLCIVALWCLGRRHPVLGVLVVAETWWANYYSAYMASIGAGLFLVAWTTTTRVPARRVARAVARFAVTGALGVLLTAPILLPTVLAVRRGVPYLGAGLPHVGLPEVVVRLLPLTEGVATTPALAAGSIPLALALGLPAHRGLPLRQRLSWSIAVLVVLASILWRPTLLAWNAFDVPNGNPYRFSFVLVGLLLIGAWLALQSGQLGTRTQLGLPSRPAALLGCALVILLAVAAPAVTAPRLHVSAEVRWWSTSLAAGLLLAVACRGRLRSVAVTLVVLASCVETVVGAHYVDAMARHYLGTYPMPTTRDMRTQLDRARAATQQAGWPERRAVAAPWPRAEFWMSFNAPLYLDSPGIAYYSSTLPLTVARTLQGLGVGAWGNGRVLVDVADPGLDPLLAVGARGSDHAFTRSSPTPSFPLVRVVSPPQATGANGLPAPMRARNALVDHPVYAPVRDASFSPAAPGGLVTAGDAKQVTVQAGCPAGQVLQVVLEPGEGTLQWTDHAGTRHRMGVLGPTVATLSPAPAGPVTITGRGHQGLTMAGNGLVCLDQAALDRQVGATVTPAIHVAGARVAATFPAPVHGDLVVATVAQPGWTCTLDGVRTAVTSRSGLLAVHAAGQRTLECRHRTPGLAAGLAAAAGALVACLALAWFLGRRRTDGADLTARL